MSELKKGWYVLRTLTGQEQKVQKLLEAAAIEQGLGDCIGEALVPVERVIRVKNGKKTSVTRKLFPGYVFLEAALYDSEHKIYAPAWSCIRNVQGVIGFLGGDPPHPLSDKEVEFSTTTIVARCRKKKRTDKRTKSPTEKDWEKVHEITG